MPHTMWCFALGHVQASYIGKNTTGKLKWKIQLMQSYGGGQARSLVTRSAQSCP